MEPVYSGQASKDFWKRIDLIKSEPERSLIYLAGCALQEHEARVLQMIEQLDRVVKRRAKSGKTES